MATNKNITMKQFNGTDYDTLYPKTKVEQVEGAYTQQQILADSTKVLFGMGDYAVPDDVLAYLGRYNQYWWKRRVWADNGAYEEWNYVQSSERNAYPDSGVSNGYEYKYLGIPFDNAVNAPKIATGSYTGTGTYGSSNPNSLTFDFEPKIVIIQSDSETASGQFPYIWGASYMYVTRGANSDSNFVSVSSNTMSWYCSGSSSSNAKTQLNSSGVVYSYIAIC